MLDRSGKISRICLTPLCTTPRRAGLSLAGIIVMAAAMAVPADAKPVIIAQDAASAEEQLGYAHISTVLAKSWDRRRAAFDKLRLRSNFVAITGFPRAELVEARTARDAAKCRRTEMCAYPSEEQGVIVGGPPIMSAPVAGALSGSDYDSSDQAKPLLFGPDPKGMFFLAQTAPTSPVFSGTVICDGEGACVGIPFPRPGGYGPPEDGGVPPQAGSPSLTVPDLLVTKPRVAPDLEGRFSNGGNEEIW